MSWNHRVLRYWDAGQTHADLRDGGGFLYRIEEVYYDDEGNPTSWTLAKRFLVHLESAEDLRWEYDMLQRAFEKPMLEIQGNKLVPVSEEDDV